MSANQQEPSDPVERADRRRAKESEHGDVHVDDDGKVEQREHGNIDETMTGQKEGPPEEPVLGPNEDPKQAEPGVKKDLEA